MIKKGKFIAMFSALAIGFSLFTPNVNVFAADMNTINSEYLSRGVVAVRDKNAIFVSWRALTSDSPSTSFNIYKSINGGAAVKLNSAPITNSSNYTDKSADVTKSNTYYITAVDNGKEGSKSESYTLGANAIDGPVKVIPIKNGTTIKSVTVGDFNGDGNYDYLVSRASENHQLLEAYLNDGTYLWTIDLGKNSENKNNITPGASTIDVGHWDGATVYDINGDGKAEVLLRIANDVTFGDKTKFTYKNDVNQWFAVVDGMTGSCKDKAPIPDDYISDGPLGAQVGIGYLDGKKPSLVAVLKNRQKNKAFNMIVASYSYTNGKFQMDWKWKRNINASDGHQFRIADVNNDGKDEILEIGFCLNGDGTLRYSLDSIAHGDRFYVGKFNKDDKEMMGYGIQQENPSGLLEYYYNASTGKILWEHKSNSTEPIDVGRGAVGDIDPTQDGLEAWSFSGIYNAKSNKLLSNAEKTLWPSISFRWDGDLLAESYNDGKIEKWDYNNKSVSRLLTCSKIHSTVNDNNLVMGYGDIFGDWREEVICSNLDFNELVIYTTNIETQYKIPCLAQDRAYRNCMTLKGYKQSHMTGFYLGADRTDYSSEFKGTSGSSSSEPESTIKTGAQIKEGKYRIKNLRSGLYLDVTDGKAANGTNVQQWAGSSDPASYNTWSLKSQGNGYYKIYSEVGDKQYLLDLDYGKADNGTNIQIYKDTKSDAQQFKFVKARDNSYVIYTKATNDASCLDVYEASSSNGANICEWEANGGKNQMWLLEEVTDSNTGNSGSTTGDNTGNNNSGSSTGTLNNNISVDYKYNNWGTSFQTDFTITNKGTISCTNWRLKLKASDFDVTSSWNVDVKKSGSDVIITPASWQAALSPNTSASFGIVSNGSSKDTISYTVDFMDASGKVIATSSK